MLETFDYSRAGLPNFPPLALSRVLFVSNTGRLELHGRPKLSWTYLAASAAAGTRRIRLEHPTAWQRGDEILMAPTGAASTFGTHRIAKVLLRCASAVSVCLDYAGLLAVMLRTTLFGCLNLFFCICDHMFSPNVERNTCRQKRLPSGVKHGIANVSPRISHISIQMLVKSIFS